MTVQPAPSPIPASYPSPLRCEKCHRSGYLRVEDIDAFPDPTAGLIRVGYSCTNCGSFRSHAATVADVADILHRSANPPGVLQFGNHHLHCGVPMHTGAGKQHMLLAGSNGRPMDADLEVYLSTRVLHCDECGFQMEIPD